ncbi:hypothetical protein BGM09_21345 [Streptomyces sp. CBMA29]|nr:FCD domain-containing protein [Streptomyces sp. CBMA29]MBD0735649.1 hypothetical protein [Streptomyces sp. CBMA29]
MALQSEWDAVSPRRAAHAVEADLAFHRALLAATHNELLERMETVIESGLARDEIVHSSPHGQAPDAADAADVRAPLDAAEARWASAASPGGVTDS